MSLRVQLLLVSLSLLGIPWTAQHFLKANEQTLRALQQQALESTALAIASGLSGRVDMLYTSAERLTEAPSDNSLQVHNVATAPVLDGYFDDWQTPIWRQFGTNRRPLHIALTRHEQKIFIAIRAFDDTKRYETVTTRQPHTGDRLVLTFWHNDKRQKWPVSPSAPGDFVVYSDIVSAQPQPTHPIRGYWADVDNGYQIEIMLPLETMGGHLGINYIDVDEGGESYRGNSELSASDSPPRAVVTPLALSSILQPWSDRSMHVRLVDRWGWELGQSSSQEPMTDNGTHGLTQWIYRALLPTPIASAIPIKTDSGRFITGTAASALQNKPLHRLLNHDKGLIAQFATPITNPNATTQQGIIGAVVIEQAREQYLALNDAAFERLLYTGSLAMLAVILALLGYAGLLSLRIVRLNTALTNNQPTKASDRMWLGDEVQDLAQQFHALREDQRRLEDYLRSLPRTLAHEIRTPVAVISSTLENIEKAQTQEQREILIKRAKSGLERLTNMLNAMNEATRLESSVGNEHYETVDLIQLLTDLTEAYSGTFGPWLFELQATESCAEAKVVPDLVVQALDKLVANATSFTSPGLTIQIKLERRGIWWRLSVRNPGPALPDVGDVLFTPMRSIREHAQRDEHHMGLGLYMVSLIARHHGGEPFALSTDNPMGAEVGFSIATTL